MAVLPLKQSASRACLKAGFLLALFAVGTMAAAWARRSWTRRHVWAATPIREIEETPEGLGKVGFRLRNPLACPATITSIQSSCGCLALHVVQGGRHARVPLASPLVLESGEDVVVRAFVDLARVARGDKEYIRVTTDDDNDPIFVLALVRRR